MLLFAVCIIPISIFGQNLIPNPSFELNEGCPKKYFSSGEKWLIMEWRNASGDTPDYYHTCGNEIAGNPQNWVGNTVARNGNAYVGLYVYGVKEYMYVALEQPLKSGRQYQFEAFVKFADHTHLLSCHLDFGFSSTPLDDFQKKISVEPLFGLNKSDPWQGDPLEWEKVSGSFRADGSERYLIIGNLHEDRANKTVEFFINEDKDRQLRNKSYVLVDHLKLWPVGGEYPKDPLPEYRPVKTFSLSDIQFEFDEYELPQSEFSKLAPIVSYARKLDVPYKIEIKGYTDPIGSVEYNQELSLRRAYTIREILISRGFSPGDISAVGLGEATVVTDNMTDEDLSEHRKVEVIVLLEMN